MVIREVDDNQLFMKDNRLYWKKDIFDGVVIAQDLWDGKIVHFQLDEIVKPIEGRIELKGELV